MLNINFPQHLSHYNKKAEFTEKLEVNSDKELDIACKNIFQNLLKKEMLLQSIPVSFTIRNIIQRTLPYYFKENHQHKSLFEKQIEIESINGFEIISKIKSWLEGEEVYLLLKDGGYPSNKKERECVKNAYPDLRIDGTKVYSKATGWKLLCRLENGEDNFKLSKIAPQHP